MTAPNSLPSASPDPEKHEAANPPSTWSLGLLVGGAVGFLGLGVLVLSLFAPGCNGPTDSPGVKKETPTAEGMLSTVYRLVREGKDIQAIQGALELVNEHLNASAGESKAAVGSLKLEEEEALQARFGLSDSEVKYLRQAHFDNDQDALHLEAAFLFLETVRSLTPVGTRQEQAQSVLGWVTRNVLLHEQKEADLPPSMVVRQGYGGARDRALVFLALLQQLDMAGCLVTADVPEGPAPLLAGVLMAPEMLDEKEENPDKDAKGIKKTWGLELFLFDLRRGRAVPGPEGKGVATLRQAVKQPDLLTGAGFPKSWEKWRLGLATPLSALSPRMHWLEEWFAPRQRVHLYQDVVKLIGDLESCSPLEGEAKPAISVASWKAPAKAGGSPAPVHLLGRFLAPAEKGAGQRLENFELVRLPLMEVNQEFRRMRLLSGGPGDIPVGAAIALRQKVHELFGRFVTRPRDLLLRGRVKDALAQLNRIDEALKEFDDLDPAGEAQFQKELEEWREQLTRVHAALARKDKGAESLWHRIWSEDQYLVVLVSDEPDAKPDRKFRKVLSGILFRACREPLGREVRFLTARCLQEKAADAQDELVRGDGRKEDARAAWGNAALAWKRSLRSLNSTGVKERIGVINDNFRAGFEEASISLLETLHLDLHRTLAAKYHLAQAQAHRDMPTGLAAIQEGVEELRTNREIPSLLEALQKHLKALDGGKRNVVLQSWSLRVELLARDWRPGGPWETWRALLEEDFR